MTATSLICHILAVEITGVTRSSPRDLGLSLAILTELVASSETCETARAEGNLLTYPLEFGVFLLFAEDETAPLRCVLELWEMLREFPLISVRTAIQSGPVDVEGGRAIGGDGIDDVRRLLDTARPGQILLTEDLADSVKALAVLAEPDLADPHSRIEPLNIVMLEGNGEVLPSGLAGVLESVLTDDGHTVSLDRPGAQGVAWAKSIESRIRSADAVVVLVPGEMAASELLQYEVEIAIDEFRKRGRPHVMVVWQNRAPAPDSSLARQFRAVSQAVWTGPEDLEVVSRAVRDALSAGNAEAPPDRLDTTGSAISRSSKYYVVRDEDRQFERALANQESIVLVKGPKQIGKTSLLGRGIEVVDQKGWRCAATDFQLLSPRQLDSEQSFYRVVVTTLCRQLHFEFDFENEWMDDVAPIFNMDLFMRELLEASDIPLVWVMDEADRLFTARFANDFFGLVRSWHNARATDPDGPWERFTVAIGYATEVHLFIKDLNKSPFNVGIPIALPMFTLENAIDLNQRYGAPIGKVEDVSAIHSLLGGQPFLVRRAFDILVAGEMTVEELLADADHENGPFGDHLKRVLLSVTQLQSVWDALVESLASPDVPDSEGVYRLIAANVLVRRQDGRLELPCELYWRYLSRYVHRESSR